MNEEDLSKFDDDVRDCKDKIDQAMCRASTADSAADSVTDEKKAYTAQS